MEDTDAIVARLEHLAAGRRALAVPEAEARPEAPACGSLSDDLLPPLRRAAARRRVSASR
jgi:hypothetical protein